MCLGLASGHVARRQRVSVLESSTFDPTNINRSRKLTLIPPKPPVVSYADFQGQLMEVEYSYTTITIDETGKPEVTHSSSTNGLYIAGDWHSVKHDVYGWGVIGEGATKRAIYVRILLF